MTALSLRTRTYAVLTGVALAGIFTSCSRSEPASELAPRVGERSQALVTMISTCAELQDMEDDLSGDYQLANDIECGGWDPEGNGKGFRPVGIGGWIYTPFEGHFDGAGHVIRNLTINRPLEDSVGLFGLAGAAVIERVGLESVSIVGYEAVGAVVGATEGTLVREVYATGSISGHLAGGIVGFLKHEGILRDSHSRLDIDWEWQGGLLCDYLYYGAHLERSYAVGTGDEGRLYGDIGEGGTVTGSFFDCEIAGDCTNDGGATTAQLKSQAFLEGQGWDFTNTWAISSVDGYPCLRSTLGCGVAPSCGDGVVSGSEVCDPGLDPGCKPDCTGPITDAQTELSCQDGADNDADALIDCLDVADCNLNAVCRADEGQSCIKDFDCETGLVCTAESCRRSQCENGVKDANEQATDCGGPCRPCDGSTCSLECRTGESVTPTPTATLALHTGTFQRASTASFIGPSGQLEYARPDEARHVTVGSRRLLLVEGESANLLRYSEAVDRSDTWIAATSSPTLIESGSSDPQGGATAERVISPEGGGNGPAQTGSAGGAATTFSAWMRYEPESAQLTARTPITAVVSSASAGFTDFETWSPGLEWSRAEAQFASTAQTLDYSFSTILDAEAPTTERPSSFAIWGLQAEALPFASSYIPTGSSSETRSADVLTFAASVIPSWVRSGHWYFEVAPLYSSDEFTQTSRRVLLSLGSGAELALVGGPTCRVELTSGGAVVLARSIAWERGETLTFELDFPAAVFHVRGALSGNGQQALSGLSAWPAGTSLRIGGTLGASNEAFAAFSDLRQISESATACVPSAACQTIQCGNGILDAGEECDPALDPRCGSDCRLAALRGCSVDSECPLGQLCGVDEGDRFDALTSNVCRPAGCGQAGSTLVCGDVTSACGNCACLPNCAGAVCGTETPDGCGGTCRRSCQAHAPDCLYDTDCPTGHSCAPGLGFLFGHPFGANVCWPSSCNHEAERLSQCGTTASPCGTCMTLPNTCGERTCGTDQYGHSCGECASEQLCNDAGRCVALIAYKQPPAEVESHLEQPPQGAPGSIEGTASVSSNGTAIYRIPLHVPPGRAGLTPQLSLSYNSAGGLGPLGQGWTLDGLSSITRCPRTAAQEGAFRGVRFQPTDRFCLDGKRLRVATEGTYGGDGTVYTTQFDDLRRVTSHVESGQGSGSGPTYFELRDLQGRLLTFGRSQSARVTVPVVDGSPLNVAWFLESVEDTSGNKIVIAYDGYDFETGTVPYPRTISYGHEGSNVIRFHPSSLTTWVGGSYRAGYELPRVTRPIGSISFEIGAEDQGSYQLTYERRGTITLLKSVSECWNGCLNPTTFEYGEQDALHILERTSDSVGTIDTTIDRGRLEREKLYPDAFDKWEAVVADFNMDGADDLLHWDGYVEPDMDETPTLDYALKLARPQSVSRQGDQPSYFADAPLGALETARCKSASVFHYNDDSYPDVLAICGQLIHLVGYGELRVYTNDGTGTFSLATTVGSSIVGHWAVDLDSDGRQDVVYAGLFGGLRFARNAGGTLEPSQALASPPSTAPAGLVPNSLVLDDDADGVPSFVYFAGGDAFIIRTVGAVQAWQKVPGVDQFDAANARVADMNGDGLPDLVQFAKDRDRLLLYLNTGAGFAEANTIPANREDPNSSLTGHFFNHSFVMDINNDGFEEVLVPFRAADDQGYYAVSFPDLQVTRTNLPLRWGRRDHKDRYGYQKPRVGDFNGDGSTDVVFRQYIERDRGPHDQHHPVLELWSAASASANLLTVVTDGLGKRTELGYSSVETGQSASGCTFPRRCVSRPAYRLVDALAEVGASGPYRDPTQPGASHEIRRVRFFDYRNASFDALSATFLGFEQMTEREVKAFPTAVKWHALSETITDFSVQEYDAFERVFFAAGKPRQVRRSRYLDLGQDGSSWQVDDHSYRLGRVPDGGLFVERTDSTSTWGETQSGTSATLGSRVTHTELDDYGRQALARVTWSDGRDDAVTTTYFDETDPRWSQWSEAGLTVLPRVMLYSSSDVFSEARQTQQYSVRFDYNLRGLPTRVQQDLGDPEAYEVRRDFDYDQFGNQTVRIIAARDAETLTETDTYDDATHTFLSTRANNLHAAFGVDDYGFDARNGKMTWVRRIDGSWLAASYDGSGRVHRVDDSSGSSVLTDYLAGQVPGCSLRVETSGAGRPSESVDYNAFGQPVLETSTHWAPGSGAARTTVRELGYDLEGRLVARGLPHLQGTASSGYKRIGHDYAGRVEVEGDPWQRPDGTFAEHETQHTWIARGVGAGAGSEILWRDFSVRAHVVTSGAEQLTTLTDLRGDEVTRFDADGEETWIWRGPFGRVWGTGDFHGTITHRVLDPLGKTLAATSSEDGTRTFFVDGLGRRRLAIDALSATVMNYDALGRPTLRSNSEGVTAQFTYDRSDPAALDLTEVGKVVREELVSQRLGTHSTEYEWHGPSAALSKLAKTIDGEPYETLTEYDALGRAEFVHYPRPAGSTRPQVVQYVYDPRGAVSEILEAAVLPGEQARSLWKAVDVDAFRNYSEATALEGFSMHRTADITGRRREQRTGAGGLVLIDEERYHYNEHGYLVAKLHPQEQGTDEELTYDNLGRLEDHVVGGSFRHFAYDAVGNLTEKFGLGTLHYPDAAHPSYVFSTDSGRGFDYDDLGRQDLRTGPAGDVERQEVDYTYFDLPAEVRIGPDGDPDSVVTYHYDANERKVSEELQDGARTTYVDDLLRWTRDGTAIDERVATVIAPDGTVLEALLPLGDARPTYRVNIPDYQGSPRVVIRVDGPGQVSVEKRTFDAWGAGAPVLGSSVGYTGHEDDLPVGLTNMKGRLYDQSIGRFITPDPIAMLEGHSQRLNRYSYVLNSPANFVDPTGFQAAGYGAHATVPAPPQLPPLPPPPPPPPPEVTVPPPVVGAEAPPGPGAGSATNFSGHAMPLGGEGSEPTLDDGIGTSEDFVLTMALFGAGRVPGLVAAGIWSKLRLVPGLRLVLGGATRGAPVAASGASLLARSEAAGGHLIARHVGQTVEQLSARLAGNARLQAASTFKSLAQAEGAVAGALQHGASQISSWVASGASGRLVINAPFSGGSVLLRGASSQVSGTGVRVVLQGNGSGGWHVLTGFPIP